MADSWCMGPVYLDRRSEDRACRRDGLGYPVLANPRSSAEECRFPKPSVASSTLAEGTSGLTLGVLQRPWLSGATRNDQQISTFR
jgi:hypothetical protein